MTNQQHPITPPPELVEQWYNECPEANEASLPFVATQAARWGADQELEACCAAEHTVYGKGKADWLRSLRRPKPPSLKEQALEELDKWREVIAVPQLDIIRRALEQLND